MKAKQGRGRPEADIAERLRNWGWVWLVKQESGLSYEKLDNTFVQRETGGRLRVFQQIAMRGSSPQSQAGSRARRDLFKAVHSGGRFQTAHNWFNSPIWELLTQPGLSEDYFRAYVRKAIADSEAFRIEPKDTLWAEWVLGNKEPALAMGVNRVYSASIHYFTNNNSANAVALLAAMYREAHADFEVDVANILFNVVRECALRYVQSLNLPDWLQDLFVQLCHDRLLKGRWVKMSDFPEDPKGKKLSEWMRGRAFALWYCSPSCPAGLPSASRFPILPAVSRLRWLNEHRDRLTALYSPIYTFDRTPSADHSDEALAKRRQQRDALIEEVRKASETVRPEEWMGGIQAMPVGWPSMRIAALPEPANLLGITDDDEPWQPFDDDDFDPYRDGNPPKN